MKNTPLLSASNNYTRNPSTSRLDEAIIQTENAEDISSAIIAIGHWLRHCFNMPAKFPLFCHRPGLRAVRSERREAIAVVLLALLRNLEVDSLLIGYRQPDGQFVGLTMQDIALESGLGQRRCERVIFKLKRVGALEWAVCESGQTPALAFVSIFVEWMAWEAYCWHTEPSSSGQSDPGAGEARS